MTNRNGYIRILLVTTLLLPVIFSFLGIFESFMIILLTFIPAAVLLWLYFGTYYIVKESKLFYRSAFISGYVEVQKIREIVKGRTSWLGLKPATAANGLIIKFNTHDEIYISPKDNESLIAVLKGINSNIKVMG